MAADLSKGTPWIGETKSSYVMRGIAFVAVLLLSMGSNTVRAEGGPLDNISDPVAAAKMFIHDYATGDDDQVARSLKGSCGLDKIDVVGALCVEDDSYLGREFDKPTLAGACGSPLEDAREDAESAAARVEVSIEPAKDINATDSRIVHVHFEEANTWLKKRWSERGRRPLFEEFAQRMSALEGMVIRRSGTTWTVNAPGVCANVKSHVSSFRNQSLAKLSRVAASCELSGNGSRALPRVQVSNNSPFAAAGFMFSVTFMDTSGVVIGRVTQKWHKFALPLEPGESRTESVPEFESTPNTASCELLLKLIAEKPRLDTAEPKP